MPTVGAVLELPQPEPFELFELPELELPETAVTLLRLVV
jgi:hypothetical protein